MGTIAKVTAGGATHLIASTCYGTCSTAAATAAKVATIQDSQAFTLLTGTTVHIKFSNSNTVASPTLNVNSTGAKSIMRYGTTAPSTNVNTSWNAGSVISFTYDGTYWQMNDFGLRGNDNTTYSAGTGLSLSSTTFNHSNSVTAQTTQAVYPIKIDAQGHINGYGSAVSTMTQSNIDTGTSTTGMFISPKLLVDNFLSATLLWTNASPSSTFGGQAITVPDYSGYTFLIVEHRSTGTRYSIDWRDVVIGEGLQLSSTYGPSQRVTTFTDATTITFGNGTYSGAANNTACIPEKIWGLK